MSNVTRNGLGEPLPWEVDEVVTPPQKNMSEPQKGSLEYMKAHLKELIMLRAGRIYSPERETSLDTQVEEAQRIFVVESETSK